MKPNFVILLMAIVFACPGLAAYEFYMHPQWLSSSTNNKGKLLNFPQPLSIPNTIKPSWRLLLWNLGDCDKLCQAQLDKLARIRLALGRHLYEVSTWLVIDSAIYALPKTLLSSLEEQDIHVLSLSDNQLKQTVLTGKSHIFIANPNNYLILSYEPCAKSEDIFSDIRQLLQSNDSKASIAKSINLQKA